MIMSRVYVGVACITSGILSIFMVKYLESRPRVEVTCEDPQLGKFQGELHPSRVIETPLGWVIIRKEAGVDKTEVYQSCSRYWP